MRFARCSATVRLVPLCIAALASMIVTVYAQTVFESLVMPGPLAHGHAKLEGTCDKCHDPFTRQAQSKLCLNCHKDVAADRAKRVRYHGQEPSAATKDCKHCHTEHKGREAATENDGRTIHVL